MKMKGITALLFVTFLSSAAYAQLTVTNNMTVEQYVQNVLLGNGVSVSNIQYNGGSASQVQETVGEFADPAGNVGLTGGFIMGSGDVQLAAQPNMSGSESLGGTGMPGTDTDLQSLTNFPINDECVIEFDFIPSGDTISFRYIFASEEYPEFACSEFNDVFGFFLTGPNPNGPAYSATNIARVPDPNNPGMFTNTPVAINSITPGVSGLYGDDANCDDVDPNWMDYNVFYVPNDFGTDYEYDGRTTVLTAVAAVTCGQTYHIKLAIGDAGDAAYDSGVFLEANSFNSNGLSIVASTIETWEGCSNAYFVVTRSDTNTNATVPILIQGDAINGEDYELISSTVVFEPGELTDTIFLNTFANEDFGALSEYIEILIDNPDACGGPSITIHNVEPLTVSISQGDTICTEDPLYETHQFTSVVSGGAPFGYGYYWSAYPDYNFGLQQGQPGVVVAPGTTTNFQLTAGDACGNIVTSQVEVVYVECLIKIPNVITPDGDGINDFFEIRNVDDYPNSDLVILNRWGTVVFEKTGYTNDWNGDDLSEGVYFYRFYPNGLKYETGMYHGFVEIIR